MKFEKAISVLRDAAFKTGGELFAKEAINQIGQTMEGKELTNISVFVEQIMDASSYYEAKNQEFWELCFAIDVLVKAGEES